MNNTGGAAFPNASIRTKEGIDVWGEGGMTLRDYFATRAMQGAMTNAEGMDQIPDNLLLEVAQQCYRMADAMLKARGQ